ncbi:MAG: carbon-nitrogen hydrolase family protein [Solirubrobacterales bacterium]|nr:carbon-nitrogen hydrolase family protein [Solirubrobacterales bacterium]
MVEALRLAVVQPKVREGEPERDRVDEARDYIGQAGGLDADIVLFPEGYPGPLRIDSDYNATGPIADACRAAGVAACWSRVEPSANGAWHKVAHLTTAEGEEALRYERAHPATGDVHPTLSGTHLEPGDSLGLAELAGIKVGVLICSELWVPEVARCLAVEGAELILAPAGGGFHRVAPNWQLITRARAIENQCFVAMTQHLFGDEEGAALIAGPERVEADLVTPGIFVADLDLARLRWLRATDDSMEEPKQFDSLPGLLRMRRPEVYGALTAPRDGLYDYHHPPAVPEELLLPGAFRAERG